MGFSLVFPELPFRLPRCSRLIFSEVPVGFPPNTEIQSHQVTGIKSFWGSPYQKEKKHHLGQKPGPPPPTPHPPPTPLPPSPLHINPFALGPLAPGPRELSMRSLVPRTWRQISAAVCTQRRKGEVTTTCSSLSSARGRWGSSFSPGNRKAAHAERRKFLHSD